MMLCGNNDIDNEIMKLLLLLSRRNQSCSLILFPGSSCTFSAAGKAFLFSLHNINGYAPVNLSQYDDIRRQAMFHCPSFGPSFGHEIHISNDAINNNDSYTHCGHTYTAPPGYFRHSNCPFFAGSYKFSPTNIEVFYETLA